MFDIVDKFNGKPQVCTLERMRATMRMPVVVALCKEIADLVRTKVETVERQIAAATEPASRDVLEREEKSLWEEVGRLKKRLPAFCFQAHYANGRRSNKSAVGSGLCMFDVDDVKDVRATYEETADKLKALDVVLVHVTPSTRGLRYVFRLPKNMTIAEAQQWFAGQLGIEQYDGCTKDLARISFAVPENYVLMMDEKGLFDVKSLQSPVSPIQNQHSKTKKGIKKTEEEASITEEEASITEEKSRKTETDAASVKSSATEPIKNDGKEATADAPEEPDFKGIPYRLIIDRLLLSLGVDGDPVEGERNTTLYTLVRQLRYICDFSQERLMAVVPRWGMSEQEVAQTVGSALATVRRANLPPHLERILRLLTTQQKEMGNEETAAVKEKLPPPDHLPPLLQLLTKSYPREYHAAILMSALPILGTLATRARARYFDGAEHSLSFLTCIVAPQASGKSCTRRMVDLLLDTLQKQDNAEREKERRWMDEKKARKNSKQQPEDPRARIRIVPATVSNAMLFKRLDCSEGEHLFTYAEEVDTLSKGRKSGTWSQKDDIMRQAFDNSICGQDYMSDNSWSAMVKVFYNTLTCGTPVAVHRYYNDVEGGLVSRVCFSQLPDMLGAQMPIFGNLSKAEEEEVKRCADRLMAIGRTDGDEPGKLPATVPVIFEVPRVKQAIWDWMEARRREYLETQENPALDIFRRRAAVIGFRAGLLAMLLCDEQETDEAVAFATWVASYTLAQQLDLFGEEMNRLMLEGEQLTEISMGKTRFESLFSALPKEFTIQQLAALRAQTGAKSPSKQMIWRWKRSELIEETGKQTYKKLAWK